MDTLKEKYAALIALLSGTGKLAVAFSAGVDSTFLLKAAREALGENVIALTAQTVAFPARERDASAEICRALGVEQVAVPVDLMAVEGFRENPPERCYLCKKALFTAMQAAARERGFGCVAEGSNTDDAGDYRPGLRALRELGIRSPLREAGLSKAEIRELSRRLELPTWDKPSYACLATRIAYGQEITPEALEKVETAEQYLYGLGFRQVRVRVHGDLARIEIPREQFPLLLPTTADAIHLRLRQLGFRYVALDLGGFESGSMNRALS
jgi:uncharacterized protein